MTSDYPTFIRAFRNKSDQQYKSLSISWGRKSVNYLIKNIFIKGASVLKSHNYFEIVLFAAISTLDRRMNFQGRNIIIFRLTISGFWPKYSHINHWRWALEVICREILISTRSSFIPSCIILQCNIFNKVVSNAAITAQRWSSTSNRNMTKTSISRFRN